jgi:hypothetical protein
MPSHTTRKMQVKVYLDLYPEIKLEQQDARFGATTEEDYEEEVDSSESEQEHHGAVKILGVDGDDGMHGDNSSSLVNGDLSQTNESHKNHLHMHQFALT